MRSRAELNGVVVGTLRSSDESGTTDSVRTISRLGDEDGFSMNSRSAHLNDVQQIVLSKGHGAGVFLTLESQHVIVVDFSGLLLEFLHRVVQDRCAVYPEMISNVAGSSM